MITEKEKTSSKIILFSFIWLMMFGYVLRNVVEVNFEILFLIMLTFSLWVILRDRLNTKKTKNVSLFIWSWLIVFYWFIALVILFYHDGLEGRSGNTMNVVHSVLVFVAMGWALYKLKPTIDYLWISVGIGSFFILFLSFLEFAAVDFNLVGRLGDFYGNPIGFGILANTFLIILVGALPWAFFKNKIIFGAYLIMGIMLLTAVIFLKLEQLG
ncbi:hypothetical protein [Thiomicrorhabdus aquaedulcis]|uniref:hypothetical protein n=1 Tax=Thiomicrorhabdus aquaedulcis TaxID=2211106 RepID=UPI000FDC882B|nr:hypothetical protein [Thiomicrorhabdus aquaedulcis]